MKLPDKFLLAAAQLACTVASDNVAFAFPRVNLCEEAIKIDKACHTSLYAGQTVRTTLPKGRPSTR